MTIFTPNIVISKSYEFMNKFMAGAKLSDISSDAVNDSLVFLNKQNRYVYSLEHSHNFGQSDMGITLRIVDTDGDFENQFLNETFYEKLISTKVSDYLKSNIPGREFNNYFASVLETKLKIYVAYGVGDDLNNWSDPIACTMVAANIDVANNGLRKYTYQFQAIPNNLFIAPPQRDPNDPNANDYINLGFANISITSETRLDDPSKATMNIKNILTKFCQKISHTNIGNVVVVLPDIDSNYELWCKENKDTLIAGYSKIFKSVRAEKIPSTVVLNAIELNLTKAKTSFIDYLNEQEKKSLEAAKNAKKAYENSKSPKTGKNSLERAKESKQIDKEITQIQEWFQQWPDQTREVEERKRRQQKLEALQKRKKDLDYDRKVGNIASDDAQVNALFEETQRQEEKLRSGSAMKSLLGNLVSKIPNSLKTQEIKTPDSIKLTMITQEDGQGKEGAPKIPDPRRSILQVFEGINSILFDDNVVPVMTYETNMRWLKLFKDAGIIDNDQYPCFIVGDRDLIMHYLYGRKYTRKLNDLNYSMNPKDPLASIITNKSYGDKLRKLIFRNKTNSSFSELLAVDELSLNNEISNKALVEFKKYSEGIDNPIFINNFRNSNVLSYSFKNSENYYSITSNSVRDNRLKYLYKSLDDDKKNELLKKFGISPVPGTRTPIEIAKDFFTKAFKQLGENKDLALKKIEASQIPLLEEATKDVTKWGKIDPTLVDQLQTALNPKDTVESRYGAPKLGGLVLTHSNEGVSYLNLAIQSEIKQLGGYVNVADLAAVSELIVLLNLSDGESEDTTLNIVPGLTMPGTGFILSRIHEYSKRHSTEISIKTLPFFHISGFYDINKRCAFFSKRNQFMGKSANEIVFDFFSGEYVITGYRHVITTGECYSEFLLNKMGTSDDMNVTKKLKTADQIKSNAQEAFAKEIKDIAGNINIDVNF